MIATGAINLPYVKAAVETMFARYEKALIENDITTLDEMFWQTPLVVRFGETALYGIDAIRGFRQARDPAGLARTLQNTLITTYGETFAVATTEFVRGGAHGRQTQTWVRFTEGWRIVSAHISTTG